MTARQSAAKKAWETIRARKLNPPAPKKKIKLAPQEPIKMPKKAGAPATSSEMMMKTVVMILTINSTGNRRKLDPGMLDVQSSQEWINVTKKLMEAEELDEITSLNAKTRQYVESRALPSMIKKGVYLLPVDFVEEMNTRLTEAANELKPLVSRLTSRLSEYKAEAKSRLSNVNIGGKNRNLWNEDQFPTVDELSAAFRLTWRFVYVDSAKNLEAVSKELYAEERKKAEADWAETRETIKQVLRTNMSKMVDHMVDKLTPDGNKTKVFRDSSIEKLRDFLGTFDSRNITNDLQMKVLVDKAKSLIKDADPDSLRGNEELREYVRYGFETIKTLLDPMITVKPSRRITFE